MISLRIVTPERMELILGSRNAISRTISDVDPVGTVILLLIFPFICIGISIDSSTRNALLASGKEA